MDFSLRTKFYLRSCLFISTLFLYLFNPSLLKAIMTFGPGIKVYHILWLYLMYEVVLRIIPAFNQHTASGKHLKKHYQAAPSIDPVQLEAYTHTMNKGLYKSMLFWISCNMIIFIILLNLPNKQALCFLLFLFYYMCDMLCVNVFCVFQGFFMHNRCCNVCRIYNYDQFMYFMPFLLIPSIYTYTLVGASLFALLQWEYMHYKYPERFSSLANVNLQCKNCTSKRCKKLLPMPAKLRKILKQKNTLSTR